MNLEFRGVGKHQSYQNVNFMILYNVQFLCGMSIFNESSIYIDTIILTLCLINSVNEVLGEDISRRNYEGIFISYS
jgi:hypothetical protein